MNTLSKAEFATIENWFYRNARPLDYARFRAHFKGGSADEVLALTSAFQNPDGGLAYAYEPDSWSPVSAPIMIGKMTETLCLLGWPGKGHPVIQNSLRYLASGASRENGVWLNTIPENDNAPHAPWWSYQPPVSGKPTYNPTALLCAFILRYAEESSPLYADALALCGPIAQKLKATAPEVHELNCIVYLYEALCDKGLDTHGMADSLQERVHAAIGHDPARWGSYSMTPSIYIRDPKSAFYPQNAATVEKELDYLLQTRDPSGVWPVTWQWGSYPAEYAISSLWWQGDFAIRYLLFLRSFNRLA